MLKQLKKCLESEKTDKAIFDIVIYGSTIKGKNTPGDIDIGVIFREGSLRERLNKIQVIKGRLPIKEKTIDIKQITLKELFSSAFLAKTGIILEGISVFRGKKFSELMGFRPFSIFWYNLMSLTHAQKVKFNYILAGRNSMKGLIRELQGERLASGAVKIPIEHSLEFEEVLKKNKIDYKKKDVLEVI